MKLAPEQQRALEHTDRVTIRFEWIRTFILAFGIILIGIGVWKVDQVVTSHTTEVTAIRALAQQLVDQGNKGATNHVQTVNTLHAICVNAGIRNCPADISLPAKIPIKHKHKK